ncbi:sensor histidine kinase [Virgisporangium aurantiacum]|uniref:histidine kinase n=1 Tax=Virgisporangium aurantiacum TaxID=175570 RepID=A0A8J3ZI56_9ACTN|nr:sensor histidine kinase [Virgisporangium aurantiacum]GIJ63367.1 two-component sensor histidine kinase [Virgisporangium aurantiacum]
MHTALAPRGWLRPKLSRETATVVALAVVGAVFGAVVLAVTDSARHSTSTSTLFSGLVGGLYLTAGVIAHLRQRENRVGLLMVLTGFGWFAEDLQVSNDPMVHTIGLFTRSASGGFLVHLVLAFPDGRLRSRLSRAIVVAGYVAVFVFVPANVPFHRSVVENRLLVHTVLGFDTALDVVQMVMAAAVIVILVVRWIAASRPARRVIAPVVVAGLLGGVASVVNPWFEPDERVPYAISSTLLHSSVLLLPLAFLLGVWRVRLGRTSVAAVLVRLPRSSPTQLRDLLAWALGDPSLQVGYGEEAQPPVAPGRAVTPVERDGRRMATLVHDPALHEDRHVLQAVASAVALELDNQRLAAEVRAQLDEVRASRARIVEAGDEQRRRVERDLHDGAQQQLVTVALVLRMARQRLDSAGADPALAELLARGANGLDAALRELRELARGIHPAVLSEAGLTAAVRALAARSPASVEVDVFQEQVDALPPAVATTAYFVAAEAVTNALKHAHATTIRIALRREGAELRVSVTDDGVGGATIEGGTGLTGLRDRVAALDGRLDVHSGPSGTTVIATLPVGS